MSFLYVTENNAMISTEANCICVKYKDGMTKKIPIESLDSISIFGKSQITTQCTVECIKHGIAVVYYSTNGRYFGRLESTGHIHVERQRLQCALYESDFALELAKRIISSKIKNQEVVLKRYCRHKGIELNEEVNMMLHSYKNIEHCNSVEEIMGNEGLAARYYFQGLSKLVDENFKFEGRSKRPPKDEFNAMLSLGYSIVMNEMYGKIQNKGLNPYFGFIHKDKEKHPTLVSDMIEEWRAVIVDSVVMSLINGHEINIDHFKKDDNTNGFILTKEGMSIFINKLEKKMRTDTRYLDYIEYPVSFRRAAELQIGQLVKAIECNDVNMYHPLKIR